MQNRDRSHSRIVKMPRLHDDTLEVDIWFEIGMIYFENPANPSELGKCTVEEFEDRIDAIRGYVEDDKLCSQFVCGKQAARRFIADADELIRESKAQLHVGLPLEVIADIERSRAAISRRQGFETRKSGLVVPIG